MCCPTVRELCAVHSYVGGRGEPKLSAMLPMSDCAVRKVKCFFESV
jgi:hypothetical protein